jgi:hypothetical protein
MYSRTTSIALLALLPATLSIVPPGIPDFLDTPNPTNTPQMAFDLAHGGNGQGCFDMCINSLYHCCLPVDLNLGWFCDDLSLDLLEADQDPMVCTDFFDGENVLVSGPTSNPTPGTHLLCQAVRHRLMLMREGASVDDVPSGATNIPMILRSRTTMGMTLLILSLARLW